jgi:hypothetical protein
MLVRTIKVLFGFSDLVAWVILAIAAIGAIAFPVTGPIYARMTGQALSMWQIAALSLALLAIAVGAFLLTRRRLTGFVLVLIPAIYWLMMGFRSAALTYFAGAIAIFGTPVLLAYLDFRARKITGQET